MCWYSAGAFSAAQHVCTIMLKAGRTCLLRVETIASASERPCMYAGMLRSAMRS